MYLEAKTKKIYLNISLMTYYHLNIKKKFYNNFLKIWIAKMNCLAMLYLQLMN